MRVLGIETSCDETAVAVVEQRGEAPLRIVGQVILSQARAHEPFGGVVPEIACRSHVEQLTRVVERCLDQCNLKPDDLDGVAVAHRPGLIGALLIGVTTAKALAWAWGKPFVGVDHVAAHLDAPRLSGEDTTPPALGVVLSGGHTDLFHIPEQGPRLHLGGSQDDAVGEAFDKVASILGLPYPGGPAVERLAREGDPTAVNLPRSLLGNDSLDFSFSGIKTAVLYKWRGQDARARGPIPGAPSAADLAASFQAAVFDVLVEKIRRALQQTGLTRVILGGGVTANSALREALRDRIAVRLGIPLAFPRPELCTDNGAMIAALGLDRIAAGERDSLTLDPSPRSSLLA